MSGLSKPSFLRICSTASLVAAGPAKYAAGSPGSARVNRNVTITTPIRLGIANISRLPIMVSMAATLPRVVPANAGTHNHRQSLLQKVLTTSPERNSAAYGSPRSRGRRPEMWPLLCAHLHALSLRLHQCAIIEPAVEPVLIARDVLLHRDVDEGLIQRNARNIGEGQIDKTLHVRVVSRHVAAGCRGAGDVEQF